MTLFQEPATSQCNKACKKEGIKPIIGCEVYVAPRSRFDKESGIDDFETYEELEDVRMFLLEIALGNISEHISDTRLKKQGNDEMQCWRLIFSDISTFDYNTVFYQMTPIEIRKANLALDKVYKEMKKKTKTK